MKKMNIILAIACIVFFTQCAKQDVEWIQPWHEYTVKKIYIKDSNGTMVDILPIVFPGADRITLTKNYSAVSSDGEIKVYRTYYEPQTYSSDVYYYADDDCYYYEYPYQSQNYVVTWSNTETNMYRFDYFKNNREEVTLDFSKLDPIFAGQDPKDYSFWNLLEKKYTVEKDTRKLRTWYADGIGMTSEDKSVEIIVQR